MSFRRFLCAIALALLALQPIHSYATTPTYDAIYVFGDSYCDVGNVFLLTGGARPAPPYFNGRFSNGPLWVDHIASSLNLPMTPAFLVTPASPHGGNDYAFAGAHVVATPTEAVPSVTEQVALYLKNSGGKADPKALYILEGGGNDIVDATGVSPQDLGFQIALGIAGAELALRRAGAKNFLIPNLFDVSILPVAQSKADFAHQASLATNKSLDDLLFVEQLLQGIRIRRLNVFSLFQSVFADATHYGFTDVTNPCINPITNAVCTDPDHTLFWDVYHPTVFGHSFFAVITEAALSQ
jgi:outer membrane lipase/esterase